jgi:Secretion system C-terminal sorting domain
MKKIIFSLSLGFLSTFTYAQGLESIIVEKYYVSDAADATGSVGTLPVGSVTYRVFADLDTTYKLQAVYGDVNHFLKISTSTTFFNSEDRGATTPNGIGTTFLKNNSVALDSWVSMGAAASGQVGVLKSEDDGVANFITANTMLNNAPASIGSPIKTQDGMVAGTNGTITLAGFSNELDLFDNVSQAGSSLSVNNHAISVAGGVSGPTSTNRVLIGQFTTDGIFHFELNLQIAQGGNVKQYVSSSPVGAELSIASLVYTSTTNTVTPNVAPTVSITTPATATTYTATSNTGATVAIAATAADSDGTIDSVEFFVDGIKVGKTVSSPYTFTVVSTVGTHTLTTIATDNKGAHTTSSAVSIVVSGTTAIADLGTFVSAIALYPNPTSDVVTIEINTLKQSVAAYAIYDITGSVITAKKIGNITGAYLEKVNVSTYTPGQYFVVITLDGVSAAKKLIIN